MLDQNIFTETVREVSEIVRAAAEPLSREEILRYFDKMELNEAQKEMVLEYLLKLVEILKVQKRQRMQNCRILRLCACIWRKSRDFLCMHRRRFRGFTRSF